MSKRDHISYSFLQKLDLGPQYVNLKQEQADYFTIGSLVDCMLTEPGMVDEKFCFFTEDDIASAPKKIIDILIDEDLKLTPEAILNIAKELKYGDGWKQETVVRKVLEKGEEYYKFLKICSNKPVVTKQHQKTATAVVNSLLADPYTRNEVKPLKTKYIDCYSQLMIEWIYRDIKVQSRLDYLDVDHRDRTIQVKDLKTTSSPAYEFRYSFAKWRYDMQASMYVDAARFWADQRGLKDYILLPTKFIVESTRNIGSPLIYECSDNDINCGKYGGFLKTGGFRKGFDTLVTEYLWYLESDSWIHHKEYIENNGKFILDAFENETSNI